MDDIRCHLPENPVRFLDQVRLSMCQAGLAYRTEQTYMHWISRYIYFYSKQHPKDLGIEHIEAFLTHL